MKKMFTMFMIWRSIPAILVYLSLPTNIKNQIDMDIERLGEKNSTSASRASLNQHKIFDPIYVKQLILDMKIDGMTEAAEKAYIGTCVNVYNSLVLDRTGQFRGEQKRIWKQVKENKAWIPLLSRKQQFLANLILHWPTGYKPLYRFYAKYLLKDCYE